MTMHTERYCETLDSLQLIDAIRAIHQAYMQLEALRQNVLIAPYDNRPAIEALEDCLIRAGHVGFMVPA